MTLPQETHTAFSDAIEAGDLAAVQSLVERHPELVNHPGWTPPPLHCCVLWNRPEVAALLLDHGAEIERRDPDRQTTAIQYAVVYCKQELISVLIARGAKTTFDSPADSLLSLARRGADGEFEEYDDLPRPIQYNPIVDQLIQQGIE